MQVGKNPWVVEQSDYNPEREAFYESIFSLANGYMGIRGFEEEKKDVWGYERCTFIAGVFDYMKPGITDMVNVPDFTEFNLTANGSSFLFGVSKVLNYRRELHMNCGVLLKSLVWEDEAGNQTRMESEKFLSAQNKHIACIRYKITPLNYNGTIELETGVNGNVRNHPVNDDQMKNDTEIFSYLSDVTTKVEQRAGVLTANTKGTQIEIAAAFCFEPSDSKWIDRDSFLQTDGVLTHGYEFLGEKNTEYEFCKYIAVFTSRDNLASPVEASVNAALEAAAAGYQELFIKNVDTWKERWETADVEIEGDETAQQGIRYSVFQLLQACDDENENISIGARGLTHSRYKGCYFWDTDIFLLPFFLGTNPKAARSLMMFRYHTLAGARSNAKVQNVDGARYPWMCTVEGLEQCETWDIGLSEIHITADVAYGVQQYVNFAGDEAFMRDYGAEVLIETARYWRSRFSYHAQTGRYNLLCVKGPNEYGGVSNNNTYTILMAINNLKQAIAAIEWMKSKYALGWEALRERLNFNENEMASWLDISEKANIGYDRNRKLYREDDSFELLEECDINALKDGDRASYHNICFDKLQRCRVLKQADVLLLMLLLPAMFDEEEKKNAWEVYEPITLHDSSLSFGTHAQFAAGIGLKEEAYQYFIKSARYDLDDVMKNVAREGIHMACLGATWQAVVHGFGGISTSGDELSVTPSLPEKWNRLRFHYWFKGSLYNVDITKDTSNVTRRK